MNRRLFNILALLFVVCAVASCGLGKNLKKAEERYAMGEYSEAARYYRKAYAKVAPKNKEQRGEIAWKMGDCYRRINFAARARGSYINAARYNYPDSTLYLYKGQVEMKMGRYKDAENSFLTYLEWKPADVLAQTGLESARTASALKENPTRYIVKRDKIFNGRRADYCPAFPGEDVSTIYFTTTRNETTGEDLNGITGMKSADMFFSSLDEKGKWKEPEPVEGDVNTEFEDGACCFTPDGKTMYFTRCIIKNNAPAYAEIYSSVRSGAAWGAATKCEISKDSLSSYAHPAVSPDGKYLYFVSDMLGGMGGLDIWRAELNASGIGAIENLGEPVNTSGDEMFPTFNSFGELFYSSDGHIGMGGLDLFKAVFDTVKEVWQVENLGYPMNSAADDFGMTFEPGLYKGYFSSNRNDARGWDHIYSFELPLTECRLDGWVYDKDADMLPDAEVTIVGDDGTNMKVTTKKDGSFSCKLKQGVNYVMLAGCRGYLNCKRAVGTVEMDRDSVYEVEFPLASISRPVKIENIFYEFDKATLTPESKTALDELIELLNDNPNIAIELSSHCDYKGRDEYNERLSQRRAESVVNYLIAGGIATDRLVAKGYGEKSPVVVTKSIAKEHPFLKVDDVLTEEFILALPEEQQEECNALNRRTEFKVTRTTYGLF